MKIRKGFVSNSSSSSFICEVCGHAESGYDVAYAEIGFATCEQGHVFCQDHISPVTKEKAEALLKKLNENRGQVDHEFFDQEEADQIAELMALDVSSFDESTMNDYGYDELPEELCPICALEALSDSDILTYILKEHGSNREFVIEKARKEFGNYEKFWAAIK